MKKKVLHLLLLASLLVSCSQGPKNKISSASHTNTTNETSKNSTNNTSSNTNGSANNNSGSNNQTTNSGSNNTSSGGNGTSSSTGTNQTTNSSSQTPAPTFQYYEDFNAININEQPSGWQRQSTGTTFTVVNYNSERVIKHSAESSNYYYLNGSYGGDYVVDAIVSTESLSKESGILFRYTDTKNFYSLVLTSGNKIKFTGKVNDVAISSKTGIVSSVQANTFYRLRVEAQGNTINCFFDNSTSPNIAVTDAVLTTGSVGLKAATISYYDNFFVSTSLNAVPPTDTGTTPEEPTDPLEPENPEDPGTVTPPVGIDNPPSTPGGEGSNQPTMPTINPTFVNGSGTVRNVSNKNELSSAISALAPGDTIVFTADYNDTVSLKNINASSSKIVLRPATFGIKMKYIEINNCQNIEIYGFTFPPVSAAAYIKVIASQDIKIHDNIFDHKDTTQSGTSVLITCYGGVSSRIEIYNNIFKDKNKSGAGGTIINGSFIKTEYNGTYGIANNVHIHDNYFKNLTVHYDNSGVVTGDSDRETIIFGTSTSQQIETYNVVENNIFDNCDGENEIITVKVSRVTIRYNYFYNCYGSVSVRFGHHSEVYGNIFVGDGASALVGDPNYQTGGIRVYGTDHRIFNNYFRNLTGTTWRSPILIDNGDSDSTSGNSHQRGNRIDVFNNTIINTVDGFYIGANNHANYTRTPTNLRVFNNAVMLSNNKNTFTGNGALTDSTNSFGNNYSQGGNGPLGSFKNVTTTDLKLKEITITFNQQQIKVHVPDNGSPLINNGLNVEYILIDLLKQSRDTNDVGAFEFR